MYRDWLTAHLSGEEEIPHIREVLEFRRQISRYEHEQSRRGLL